MKWFKEECDENNDHSHDNNKDYKRQRHNLVTSLTLVASKGPFLVLGVGHIALQENLVAGGTIVACS